MSLFECLSWILGDKLDYKLDDRMQYKLDGSAYDSLNEGLVELAMAL